MSTDWPKYPRNAKNLVRNDLAFSYDASGCGTLVGRNSILMGSELLSMPIFLEMRQHSMGFFSEVITTINKDDISILVFTSDLWRSRIWAVEKRLFFKNCDFEPWFLLTPKVFHRGGNQFLIIVTQIIQKSKNICGEPLAYWENQAGKVKNLKNGHPAGASHGVPVGSYIDFFVWVLV